MADLGNRVIYLDHGGLQRRYVLHAPPGPNRHPRPVVIMLDGRGGTPWTAMKITGWSKTADNHGFFVVYPEARRLDPEGPLHFLTNPQMWNAGAGGSDTERPDVDDVGFLRALLDDLPRHAPVDPHRIYLAGFSNGASMTYRMAGTFPDAFAAIAPIAGHFRGEDTPLTEPVPMIGMFGKLDPLSPYHGGDVSLPWGKTEPRPPAITSADRWAVRCGHPPGSATHEAGTGYDLYRYGNPGARNEVVFFGIDQLGHVWPGGHRLLPESLVGPTDDTIPANDVIWEFFRQHVRGVG